MTLRRAMAFLLALSLGLMGFGPVEALTRGQGALFGGGNWQQGANALRASILAQGNTATPHQNAVMASPPTITQSASTPPGTIFRPNTSPQSFGTWSGWNFFSGFFRSAPVANNAPSAGNVTGTYSATSWRVEASVTSAAPYICLLGSGAPNFRFIVNGQYIDATGVALAGGGDRYVHLDFTAVGGLATRDIIVEGSLGHAFCGIAVASSGGESVAYPNVAASPIKTFNRIIIAGDSVTAGTGPALANDGPMPQVCDDLGSADCWASGVGGSGYVATNSGAVPDLGQRLSDVTNYCRLAPAVLVAMGVNDIGTAQATIQAAAASDLAAIRRGCGNSIIFALGPYDTQAPSAPVANYAAAKAAIQAACATVAGCNFIDLQGVAYPKVDSTHPTAVGATILANSIFTSIESILNIPPPWLPQGVTPAIAMNFGLNQYYIPGTGYVSFSSLFTTTSSASKTNLLPNSASGYAYQTYPANTPAITLTSFGVAGNIYPEEARANQLVNSLTPATQTTASLGTGTYILTAYGGSGSLTMSAGTATGCGSGVATQGSPVTVVITVAGTCTVTLAGSLECEQLELGSFGTSCIASGASPTARTADLYSNTALLQSIVNGSDGWIYTQASVASMPAEAASANAVKFILNILGSGAIQFTFDGGTHAATTANTLSANTQFKAAGSWTGAATLSSVLNNGTVANGTYTFAGSANTFYLGNRAAGDRSVNGPINVMDLGSTPIADAMLKALTQ